MEKWIDVVTDPLGLAGFALFLVFSLLTQIGKKSRPSWLTPVFVVMASVSLVGGLWVASMERNSEGGAVWQYTEGDKSPAISGVTGNVTITHSKEKE